jgi:hypothetical protein
MAKYRFLLAFASIGLFFATTWIYAVVSHAPDVLSGILGLRLSVIVAFMVSAWLAIYSGLQLFRRMGAIAPRMIDPNAKLATKIDRKAKVAPKLTAAEAAALAAENQQKLKDRIDKMLASANAVAKAFEPLPVTHSVELDPAVFKNPTSWLAQQPPRVCDFIAANWNWDEPLDILLWLVKRHDCDSGVAAGVFWLSGAAEDFLPFGPATPVHGSDLIVAEMQNVIGDRFMRSEFVRNEFGFDHTWPYDRWIPNLEDAYDAGQIGWLPGAIPTVSERPIIQLSDIDPKDRPNVVAFMAHYGVYLGPPRYVDM